MSTEKPTGRRYKFRGSIFFPIVLVCLGIIILLNNLNMLAGDAWDTIVRLWPLLLILMGADNILKREGLVWGAVLIGVGAVFLLSNFNYLDVDIWYTILRLWPVLLIAIGLDIVIGRRRSLWVSILALLVIIAIVAGCIWAYGLQTPQSGGQALSSRQIEQSLGAARRARIEIAPAAGEVDLSALSDPGLLLSGTVPASSRSQAVKRYSSMAGDEARFTLRGEGQVIFQTDEQANQTWNLKLNQTIPVDLVINLGAGELNLDLSDLNLVGLKVNLGVGSTLVTLPSTGNWSGKINGAIGSLVIQAPVGVGLRVQADTALASFSVPAGYQKQNRLYTSPNYASAQTKIELVVGMVFGSVSIIP